jgi:hypothetical protein
MRRCLMWTVRVVLTITISLMAVRWLPVHAAGSVFSTALRTETAKVDNTWCWREICPGLTHWEPLRQRVRQGNLPDAQLVTNTLITIQHRTGAPFSGGIARSLRPFRGAPFQRVGNVYLTLSGLSEMTMADAMRLLGTPSTMYVVLVETNAFVEVCFRSGACVQVYTQDSRLRPASRVHVVLFHGRSSPTEDLEGIAVSRLPWRGFGQLFK